MNQEQKNKYERLAKITGIVIGLVLVLGISYAVFKTTTLSDKTNEISAGKLELRIDHEEDEILLENAVPITEEEGLKQSPYVFDVVNEGTIEAAYDLYIEVDEEISTLPTSVVRYYLTVEEDGVEKVITSSSRILSNEEKIEKEEKSLYHIDLKYINPEKANKYKLYLWVDYEATIEQAANKYFEARVRIEAEQIYKENKLVKVVDVSENNDGSVMASFYANGKVIIRGQGNIKTGLSDTLVFDNETAVKGYKKVFTFMGYDVSNLNTMEDIENFINTIAQEDPEVENKLDEALTTVIGKEALEEMGKDTSSITDMNSLMQYLMELGYCNTDGNPTTEGEAYFTIFEEKINDYFAEESSPPKKIILEDGVTNIPEGLFTGNEAITDVIIPVSVTSIDNRAFYGCRNLETINMSSGVTSIGNYAFYGCTNLLEIKIPNTVQAMGSSTFSNCTSLQSIHLSEGIVSIEEYTFNGCSNLTAIEMPDSVTSIGNYAFAGCIGLTELVIPENVTSIGSKAFYGCSKVTKLTIDGTKRYVDLEMSNIKELIITGTGDMANNTSNIPWYSSRSAIKKVTIRDTITNIGNNRFNNCISLTTIELPNSIKSIGIRAFYECTSLTSITIPDSVTNISASAFFGCIGLTSIVIPNSVTSIGPSTFSSCTSLTNINVDENNENYSSIDGVLFNKDQTTIIAYPGGKQGNYVIPLTVNTIGRSAFSECSSLTGITIPESVTTIENDAFYSCSGLKKLTIDGTKNYGNLGISSIEELIIIGTGDMFDFSSSNIPWSSSAAKIKKVTISDTIAKIGAYAFYKCSSLTEVVIPENVMSIGRNAYYECSGVTKLTINGTKGYDNLGMSNIEELVIIGSGEMYGHTTSNRPWSSSVTKIKKVTISDAITTIGSNAFYNCSNLTSINIPDGVTEISSSSFSGCSSLTTLNIPDGVTSIGGAAFRGCTSLQAITIPNSVKTMGVGAFQDLQSSQIINIDNTEEFVANNWYASWDHLCNAQINYLRS